MSTHVVRRWNVALATAVALVLVAGFFTVSSSLSPANAVVTVTSSSTVDPGRSFARKILKIVNNKRANHGKRKLHAQLCDSKFALNWGNHLASTDTFEHSNLYKLLDKCNMSAAAENLAKYPDGMSPRQVVRLWMGSSGHRHNLLNGTYGKTGVAVVWDDAAQMWVAVQNFTRR